MLARFFLFLVASLIFALPGAAWAGSGGPSLSGSTGSYLILGLLVVIIIMLAILLKRVK